MASQVDHPSHYTSGGIEAITVIEAWNLDFNLGNVIKYICRNGKKKKESRLTDLKKALWYLNREVENIEASTMDICKEETTNG